MTERTAVYRLYDAEDALLYVGVSRRVGTRWEQHARRKPWWPLVHHQAVIWYDTREDALLAEARAILSECSAYNKTGVPSALRTSVPRPTVPALPSRPDNDSAELSAQPGISRPFAYQRIADDLRYNIKTGGLRPDERLPSRKQLANQYQVTDRAPDMAVRLLITEGLVFTRPGAGAFVAAAPELREMARTWDDPGNPVPPGTTRATETVTARRASHLEAESLGIPPGAPVLVITRRYWAGDKQEGEAVVVLAGSRDAVTYDLPRT